MKIDFQDCQFYKDSKDFLRYAKQAFELNTENSTDNDKHKIALITGYTGLNFLLLSILRASIPNEKQKEHVIYKRKFEVKNSKLVLSESINTIDTEELLKRLKGCNYELKNIKDKIKSLADVRNNVIHHFNDKPNNELINNIVNIFIVVKDIITDHENFWGDNWQDLLKNSEYVKKIGTICSQSYEKFEFTPNYYFSCLSCASDLLLISNKQKKTIVCQTCKKEFNYLEKSSQNHII